MEWIAFQAVGGYGTEATMRVGIWEGGRREDRLLVENGMPAMVENRLAKGRE